MNQAVLRELGLSPNEAKIYETLVELGESSISKVAAVAGVYRRNAYDAVSRLIDKGLIFEILSGGENRYNAVDPGKLLEIADERKQKIESILPELQKKFKERLAPEEAYIYRGLEGQKNIWRDVLRVNKESYFIGAKAGWFDPRLESNRIQFFKEAIRKKIKFIQLFDHEVKAEIPKFPKHFPGDLKYRFLPKKYSTNSGIHIFGDYVITYAGLTIGKINEKVVFFVIRSHDLAESYRTWFWYMWEQSSEK